MEKEIRIQGFDPIIDENSKILILGTLPGQKSINNNEYYSDTRNQFWKILSSIFDKDLVILKYKEKIAFLRENHIALWDVYESAERKNSDDKNIRNGKLNDFKGLLKRYPNIEKILVVGDKAQKAFEKYLKINDIQRTLNFENTKCNYTYLPSSSGGNPIPKESKIDIWKKAIL